MTNRKRLEYDSLVDLAARFVIAHEITDDLFDGRPCPPIDDRLWALVRGLPDQKSLWRSISCNRHVTERTDSSSVTESKD
jgi:hypothetical protein